MDVQNPWAEHGGVTGSAGSPSSFGSAGNRREEGQAQFIGVLVGMMLPAIGGARAAARRARCQNNLRQVGLGLLGFLGTHNRFPNAGTFVENPEVDPNDPLGMSGKPPSNLVSLSDLSSMERSRLRDAFRAIEVWQERAAYHYRTDLF